MPDLARLSALLSDHPSPTSEAIARAVDALLERHACSAPRPGDDDEADMRHAFRWLLRMAERTHRRLLDTPAAVDGELLRRFEAVLQKRPARDSEHAQLHVDPASSLRRAEIVRAFVERNPGPVLAVGDDDALTLALALMGVPDLHAVDIDERILAFLAESARDIGATIDVARTDVLNEPLPVSLRKRCAAVVTDPIRSLEPTLAFVLFGAAAMRRDAPSRLFLCDHPEWSFEHGVVVETLEHSGFRIVASHEDLHAYPLDANAIDTDRIAAELGVDARWLRELAEQTCAWSNLYEIERGGLARTE